MKRMLKIVAVAFGLFVVLVVVVAITAVHANKPASHSGPDLWTYDHRPAWAAGDNATDTVKDFERDNMPALRPTGGFSAIVRVGINPNIVWIDENVWPTLPETAQQEELRKWSSYFKAKGASAAVEFRTATNERQLASHNGN